MKTEDAVTDQMDLVEKTVIIDTKINRSKLRNDTFVAVSAVISLKRLTAAAILKYRDKHKERETERETGRMRKSEG